MEPNILLLILLWTFAPFFKKWAMVSISSSQILLFQSFLLLPLNVFRGYKLGGNEVFYPTFNRWFFISVFGTFLSSVVFMLLCKKLNPSDFIPIVQPAVIVITNVIDMYMGKKVGRNKIIGCAFILIGLIILNRKEAAKAIIKKIDNPKPNMPV